MRSFALLSFLIFLLAGFGNKPVATEVCLTAEEKKLYDLIMEYRKSKKLTTHPIVSRSLPWWPKPTQEICRKTMNLIRKANAIPTAGLKKENGLRAAIPMTIK